MQSDWSRAFSIATQELDFSQPSSFHKFPKATMVYHSKLKNHIDGAIFFSKSLLPIYFRALWACLKKVKGKCMINLKLP